MKKKSNATIQNVKNIFKSVRVKLFFTLTITTLVIIIFLIIVNNMALGNFYLYSKKNTLKDVYNQLNSYYNGENHDLDLEDEMEKIAVKNNFDILIKNDQNVNVYTSNKDFFSTFSQMSEMTNEFDSNFGEVIERNEDFVIKKMKDSKNGITYIVLASMLDNDYFLYVRIPITSIQESVKISNNFLYLMAGFAILIAAVIVTYVSRKFTDPILELNKIAKNMSNSFCDFPVQHCTLDVLYIRSTSLLSLK